MAVRRGTSKWRLPEDVKLLDPVKLPLPHLKTMLEFMGMLIRNQPKPKGDKAIALKELIAAEPEKAQTAYDVIVFNKIPEASQQVVQDAENMKSHFMGVMARLLEGEQADALRSEAEEVAKKLESRIEEHGRKALAEAAKAYRPVVIRKGKKTTKIKGVMPVEFERIVQLASQRIPVMIVGPAGCGKTFLGDKVAEALDLDFYDQSCSEGVSESIFTGWLLPISGKGTFEYVSSPFIECYENGGVFLLDEIDAADPNLLTFLNKAIANECFMLPQRFKEPLVQKHPDFVVLACANTFGKGADTEYVGRNALDAATLDRFRVGMIHMDYSNEVETALVDSEVHQWGLKVRNFIHSNRLRRIMSTRVMLDLTRMKLNCEWVLEDWEKSYFADWTQDEMDKWIRFSPAVNNGGAS